MSNPEIAKLLRRIAAAYSIKDEKKFRFQIIAYQKAADAIEGFTSEVKDLIKENKLETLPGVGPSIKQHLEELVTTGEVKRFAWVLEDIPQSMFPLLDIPSFGPKTAFKLVTHFRLQKPETVVADLKKIAEDGGIEKLEGFGEKSQSDILQAINEHLLGKTKYDRMLLPFASELAEKLLAYIKKSPAVIEAYPLGSMRRKLPTIGDIDFAVATKNPQAVIDHFISYQYTERVLDKGTISASILTSGGKRVDIKTGKPSSFGSLLQHFTGSKAHNIALRELAIKRHLSLSEYGIKDTAKKNAEFVPYDSEEKFYKTLGMDFIPPEIREDTGEIEIALQHKVPTLVELKDMRGDFHLHSNYPIEPSHDLGRDTMEDMVKKAIALGYKYLGFSEHNPSVLKHTATQVYSIMEKRSKEIERLSIKYKKNVQIYSLLETDILANGKLGIDDKSMELLDATLVSIHSSFSMNKEDMTNRVLKGLSHKKAKIFSHPTGRLINQRQGYDLDWVKIFQFCKEHNKALEINASPYRLDLPDTLIKQAKEYGVRFFIDTDSHALEQMDLMRYGVDVARRGWATKHDILNALEYNELNTWFLS